MDGFEHVGHLAHLGRRHVAEDVAVEMHDAALPAGLGIDLDQALHQPETGVRDDELDAREAAFLQVLQEGRPAGLVLLGALDDAEDLTEALLIHADRHQERDVAHLAGPAPLEHDAVEIDVRVISRDRLAAPGFDLLVDLLVEVRHRPWRDPRTPEGLGDVLHTPDRDARQVHLHQSLLDRGLPAPVAFYDRRLESLTPELGNLQLHLAGARLQLPIVAPCPRILPRLRALIALGIAQTIRLRLQKRVQRLLDAAAHDLAQVILNALVVNPDDVRQGLRAILSHGGSFHLG